MKPILNIVKTKAELLAFIKKNYIKHKLLEESVLSDTKTNFRIHKHDLNVFFGGERDHIALVRILPDNEPPKHRIYRVTGDQFKNLILTMDSKYNPI